MDFIGLGFILGGLFVNGNQHAEYGFGPVI